MDTQASRVYIETRYPQTAGTDGPWRPNTDLSQELYTKLHKARDCREGRTLLSGLWKPRKRLAIVRAECKGWTRGDHGTMSQAHLRAAEDCSRLWAAVANAAALKLWGRNWQPTDYRVSGIGTAEFTLTDQDILRTLAHRETDHHNAADLHHHAARYATLRDCATCGAAIEIRSGSQSSGDCYDCATARRQGASAEYLQVRRDVEDSKRTKAL